MSKMLYTRIQDKYDTYEEWSKSNIKPINGELYIYASEDNSAPRLKIGDERVATVDALPFVGYVENSGLMPYPAFENLSCKLSNENDGNPVLTWELPNNIPDSSSELAKIIVVRDTTTVAHINQGIKIAELQPDTLTYTDTSVEVTINTPIYYYKLFAVTTKGVDNNWEKNEVTAHTPTIPNIRNMWTEKDLNLIYNQEFQQPDWKRIFGVGVYDKLTIESSTKCGVSTNTATFTPLEGFMWEDNFSRETRSINWYINKATAEIHLSSNDDINFTYTSEKNDEGFVPQTITFGITNSFKVTNADAERDINYMVQKYSADGKWVDVTDPNEWLKLDESDTTDPYRITLSVSPKKTGNKLIGGKFRIRIYLGGNFVARETFINVNCKFSVADLTWEEISELAKQGQGKSFEIGDYKEVYLNGEMNTCVGNATITFNNEKLYAYIVHTTETLVYFQCFKKMVNDTLVPVALTAEYASQSGGFSLVEADDYDYYGYKYLDSMRSLIECMTGRNNNLENYMIEAPTYMYLFTYSPSAPDNSHGGGAGEAYLEEVSALKLFVPSNGILSDYEYYRNKNNNLIKYNHRDTSSPVNWITCNGYSDGPYPDTITGEPWIYDNYQGYCNTDGNFIDKYHNGTTTIDSGSLAPIFVLGKETEKNKIEVT